MHWMTLSSHKSYFWLIYNYKHVRLINNVIWGKFWNYFLKIWSGLNKWILLIQETILDSLLVKKKKIYTFLKKNAFWKKFALLSISDILRQIQSLYQKKSILITPFPIITTLVFRAAKTFLKNVFYLDLFFQWALWPAPPYFLKNKFGGGGGVFKVDFFWY